MTRPEPSLEDKIRGLPDLEELEGAETYLTAQGQMTPRIKNLIEIRRAEMRKGER